ncbi:hypothetical protein HY933_00170 [Candidatus Falkowbacteria bacterium]|nr:hypothetical protein [Candidatus Falkowbacteria bacterium]
MEIHQPKDPGFLNDFEKKHMPFVADPLQGKDGQSLTVTVQLGEIPHPTMPEHYIQWLALYDGEREVTKINIKPGGAPAATLTFTPVSGMQPRLLAQCSIHGVWERHLNLEIQ